MKYERIKQLREDRDLTQQHLADFLQISRSAYSNYENNLREIPIQILASIADFYQTSVDYLIGRTEDFKPFPKNE